MTDIEKQNILTHETHLRVIYRDTDQMGVVYYGNYPAWFEVGRTEMLRAFGSSYKEWESVHGVLLPVVECYVKYHHPACYDDIIRIRTTIDKLTKVSITFAYEIFNAETDILLTTGYTKHPFIDHDGKILRVGDKLLPKWFEAVNKKTH